MNQERIDPVDAALAALAEDDQLELPSRIVEQRLVARVALPVAADRTSSLVRWAAALLLTGSLAGGALAATDGFAGLKRWWYSVRIGDATFHGNGSGTDDRHVEYTTADGYRVRVDVQRQILSEHSTRTRVEIREDGAVSSESEVYDVVERNDGATPSRGPGQLTIPVDEALLVGVDPLHTWSGSNGTRHSLYLVDDGDSANWVERLGGHSKRSMLVRRTTTADGQTKIRLLRRLARHIGERGSVQITEHPGGDIEVSLDDGRGWIFSLRSSSHKSEPAETSLPREFSSPSGRVRVELGDEH